MKHFPAGHSEQERLIAGSQVLAVAAFETDDRVRASARCKLDGPASSFGRSTTVLVNRLLVVVGDKVLVVVAAEADGLGVAEEIHGGSEVVGGARFEL